MSKAGELKEKREFKFAFRTRGELDDWITVIEYMKLKSVYSTFIDKICSVSLPL